MANARGKVFIISIFVVAIAAALFSIWFIRGLRSEAVAYWGVPVALNIRNAKQVELLRLAPSNPNETTPEERLNDDWAVADKAEIDGMPGLHSLRSFLLDNGAFHFDAPLPPKPAWSYALRFKSPDITTTLVIAPETATIWHLESDRQVDVSPQKKFIAYFLDDVAKKKLGSSAAPKTP